MEAQTIPYEWLENKKFHPEPLHNLILLLLEKHHKLTCEQVVELLGKAAIKAYIDLIKDRMLLDWGDGVHSFDSHLPVCGEFTNSGPVKVEKPEPEGWNKQIFQLLHSKKGSAGRREIMRFFRVLKKQKLDAIIEEMLQKGLITCERETQGKGRPKTVYKIVIDSP